MYTAHNSYEFSPGPTNPMVPILARFSGDSLVAHIGTLIMTRYQLASCDCSELEQLLYNRVVILIVICPVAPCSLTPTFDVDKKSSRLLSLQNITQHIIQAISSHILIFIFQLSGSLLLASSKCPVLGSRSFKLVVQRPKYTFTDSVASLPRTGPQNQPNHPIHCIGLACSYRLRSM